MIKKEIYLKNVNKKYDTYSWSELNCFYRAFAITFNAFDERYYDLFLLYISAYVSYIINGDKNLTFDAGDNTLKYYSNELSKIFNVEIDKIDISSYGNMKKKVYDLLENGKVVIVPCDLYYLPYSQTYMELHKRHYLIVKGINYKKNIFYVLDNMHNDLGSNTEFSDFMIETDTVYKMCCSFDERFNISTGSKFIWSVGMEENDDFLEKNKDYLYRLCEAVINRNEKRDYEKIIVKQMNKGIFDIDLYDYMEYINLKKLFFNSVLRYAKKNFLEGNHLLDLKTDILTYLKKREKLKIIFSAAYQKMDSCGEKTETEIQDILLYEKEILKKFATLINEDVGNQEKKTMANYKIINNNKAKIEYDKNVFKVHLSEDVVYDLWKNSNNGVEIYKEDIQDSNSFEIEMRMNTPFAGSSHCGIEIILENGAKILFGSLGKLNMAVHELGENPEYELFIENYPFKEKIIIKVEFDEDGCKFFMNKKLLYEIHRKIKVVQCGVFAKTWQPCRCDAEYRFL